MEHIRKTIIEALSMYGVSEKEAVDSASFVRDLGMDSLDVMEFVLVLEQELSVSIPNLEIQNISTIGETIAFIQQQAKQVAV